MRSSVAGAITLLTCLLVFSSGFALSAQARSIEAERFAQQLIDEGLAILRSDDVSGSARRERFRSFIAPHTEARKTALFTLGIHRRGAAEPVLNDFIAAFREYTIAIYEVRLDEYRHAAMSVVGSIETKPGDVIVNTRGDDPSLREPVAIGFRLVATSGTFKIVDVQVAGIWLSVEQREQFTALLSQNGGDIGALSDELRKRTARIRSEASAGEPARH